MEQTTPKVKILEPETLRPGKQDGTTTARPVSEDTRKTIGAVLAQSLKERTTG